MSGYIVGPDVVWLDTELAVRDWLVSHLAASINVRTETDSTFGTDAPNPTMTVPLVLVQRVPGGTLDDNYVTERASIDVSCFATDRAGMWNLYESVHAWMIRITGQTTRFGTVDRITVANGAGELNYNNPRLRRCVVTYAVETRPQATL